MTRNEKFHKEWRAAFGGELPLPNLKCFEPKLIGQLSQDDQKEAGNDGDSYTDCTKDIATGFDMILTLEEDLKATKETVLHLRTKLKAAIFCRDWLCKEIKKCRKVSEGLESIASDDLVTLTDDDDPSLDLPDDESLDTQSVDSAIYSAVTDSSEKPESPPLENNAPPIPQRRPSETEKGRNKEDIPDAPDTESDSDSESDDYERIYENIALLQERMKQNREQEKPVAIHDHGREHLMTDSGSDESPSGSPKPASVLTQKMQHVQNDEEFDTSFKVPTPAVRQISSESSKSFTETEIDGGSSPESLTKRRQNTWKQMAAGKPCK